jgi:hypothetical protein
MFQRCRFVSTARFRSASDNPRIIEKIPPIFLPYLATASMMFCGKRMSPCRLAPIIHGTENPFRGDLGGLGPSVNGSLGPAGHRRGANAVTFSVDIDNRPPAGPLLNMFEG